MTRASSDPFPRLADALTEVSSQLQQISTEMRGLNLPDGDVAAPVPTPTSVPTPAPVRPPTASAYPPPFAQAPFAQAPFAQAPFSQAPFSQAPFAQAPFAQPSFAQPSFAQPPGYEGPYPPPGQAQAYPPGQARPYPAGQARPYPPAAHARQPARAAAAPEPVQPAGPTLWERMSREGAGSMILAWAGGVVTLAGVVLLLVLAIQRGYIGPLPRLMLGGGLGLALLGIGLRLHRNPAGRTGALAVAATGIAVLYLDVIAATAFYGYLPSWAGLAVGLGVAGVGVAIAQRWDSQLFAVYVVICCAATAPVLTKGFVALLLGFLLIFQIATAPVQLAKRWGVLALAAAIPPVLVALAEMAGASVGSSNDARTTALLCLVTSIVQIVLATINAHLRPADGVPFGLLLAAPVPTLLAVVVVARFEAATMIALVGVLLVAVWALQRPGTLRVGQPYADTAAAAGALALFEATCIAFSGDARALALLAGGLLIALLAVRLRFRTALLGAGVFGTAGLVAALSGALRPSYLALPPGATLSRHVILTAGATGILLGVTALVTCWALTKLAGPGVDSGEQHAAWIVAGLIALYGASAGVLSLGLAMSPDTHGFLAGHVLVTVSWTVGALVLLVRYIDSTALRVGGLALVGAALAKLVLFDLSSLSGIPRVLAFLVAGLVLLGAGSRYAKLVASRAPYADTGDTGDTAGSGDQPAAAGINGAAWPGRLG